MLKMPEINLLYFLCKQMTKTKKGTFLEWQWFNSQIVIFKLLFGTAEGKQKQIFNTPPTLEIIILIHPTVVKCSTGGSIPSFHSY